MRAQWGDSEMTVDAHEELDTVIESVKGSGQPTMVFLKADNGNILVFGVGYDESVLTFFEPNGRSFHSLGDTRRKGHLRFLCRDQVDEFMKEMAVSEKQARLAAQQFLTTRERPSAVSWESDW